MAGKMRLLLLMLLVGCSLRVIDQGDLDRMKFVCRNNGGEAVIVLNEDGSANNFRCTARPGS